MNKVISAILLLFLAYLISGVVLDAGAQTSSFSLFTHEKFVLRAVRTIHSAELTYSSTYGNGNYGPLSVLSLTGLIDPVLSTGEKYGYVYNLTVLPSGPLSFRLTATPIRYPKTGRRSFYIDQTGVIHGADKGGAVATSSDPVIEFYGCNEECTITQMRTVHSAEAAYFATSGNNLDYTSLAGLFEAGLIGPWLAYGHISGYVISVVVFPHSSTEFGRHGRSANIWRYRYQVVLCR
jgi:hypothetical protein